MVIQSMKEALSKSSGMGSSRPEPACVISFTMRLSRGDEAFNEDAVTHEAGQSSAGQNAGSCDRSQREKVRATALSVGYMS